MTNFVQAVLTSCHGVKVVSRAQFAGPSAITHLYRALLFPRSTKQRLHWNSYVWNWSHQNSRHGSKRHRLSSMRQRNGVQLYRSYSKKCVRHSRSGSDKDS
mmetsp:Transcript_3688/g.7650  ORF Transcript_3688/g.7650 Transcript_3688/m.7650 type:complete len:101 (+) Transcript_3688:63-365(+)